MKRIFAIFLVMLCIAGFGIGSASAVAEDVVYVPLEELLPSMGVLTEYTVYHPLSMLLADTEVNKLRTLSEIVWLPAQDGASAGLYYSKTFSIPVLEGAFDCFLSQLP